jgi:hypothetical protein
MLTTRLHVVLRLIMVELYLYSNTVFQAKLYAIKACAVQNLDRGYGTGNIYIRLDSQAAIRALDSC